MSPNRKIETIIFDFDGVIVESMGIKENAFISLFKSYPDHLEKIVALHRAHGGLSRFEKFKIIYKDILGLPYSEEIERELGNKFAKYVYEEVVRCPFVAGAKEFLEKYHKELSFFIVSGTPEVEMRNITRARGLDKYFIGVFGSPEKKGAICQKILRSRRLSRDTVIMVGDSIDDYDGAKEAQIKFIGRITDKNTFAGLSIEGTIHDFFELEKYLGN